MTKAPPTSGQHKDLGVESKSVKLPMAAKPKKIHDFEGGGLCPKHAILNAKKELFSPKQVWAQIP